MALRSGTEHIDRWSDVLSVADLWNVAGSPNTNVGVQAGDRCYVDGVGVYQCVDPTPGAAAWALSSSSSLPTVPYLDFSAASGDYYEAPAGVCLGADDFIFAVHVRFLNPEFTGDQYIVRAGDPNHPDPATKSGFYVWLNYDGLEFRAITGAGAGDTLDQTFGPSESYFGVRGYRPGRDAVLLYQVYQESGVSNVRAWVNGSCVFSPPAAPTPNIVPGSTPMTLGPPVSILRAGISGFAYYKGTATFDQITAFFDATYASRKIENVGVPWDNLWTIDDHAPGATWAPTVGTDDLTRVGAQQPLIAPPMRWA